MIMHGVAGNHLGITVALREREPPEAALAPASRTRQAALGAGSANALSKSKRNMKNNPSCNETTTTL